MNPTRRSPKSAMKTVFIEVLGCRCTPIRAETTPLEQVRLAVRLAVHAEARSAQDPMYNIKKKQAHSQDLKGRDEELAGSANSRDAVDPHAERPIKLASARMTEPFDDRCKGRS